MPKLTPDEFALSMQRKGFVFRDGAWHPGSARAEEYLGELQRLGGQAAGPAGDPELQDRQDGDRLAGQAHEQNPGKAHDAAAAPKMDGAGHPQYRISVTLRFSDYRRKDPDGCLSTIMDCITSAVGRLLGVVSGDIGKKRVVRSRSRGGDHSNRTTVTGKVPF